MAVIRSKWKCLSRCMRESPVWDTEHKNSTQGFAWEYEFSVVTSGSEENNRFFASTPYGTFKIGAVRDDLYVPGRYYYFDSVEAIPAA